MANDNETMAIEGHTSEYRQTKGTQTHRTHGRFYKHCVAGYGTQLGRRNSSACIHRSSTHSLHRVEVEAVAVWAGGAIACCGSSM